MTNEVIALKSPPALVTRRGEMVRIDNLDVLPAVEDAYPLLEDIDIAIEQLKTLRGRLTNLVEDDLAKRGGNSRLVGETRYVIERRKAYRVDAKALFTALGPLVDAGELTANERQAALHEEVTVAYAADNRLLNELAKRGPVGQVIDRFRHASETLKVVAKRTVER